MTLRDPKMVKRDRLIHLAKTAAIASIIFLSFGLLAKVADRPSEPNPEIMKQLRDIKAGQNELKLEQNKIKEDIKELKDSTETPKWLDNEVNSRRLLQRRRILADRGGGNWINRIDRYLAGTPLAGQGRAFFMAAVDNGLPPNLSVAIAAKESSKGQHVPSGSNNPFGMTAGTAPGYGVSYGTGSDGRRPYEAFPNWETAIREHNAFIKRHWGGVTSPTQMRGYAVDPGWASGVLSNMRQI